MSRHRPPPAAPRGGREGSHEARLRALGHLLDQQGFLQQGLCVLEVDGGFEVQALVVAAAGEAYGLAQRGETIGAAELGAGIARLPALP